MRAAPRAGTGVAVWAVYVAVITVVSLASGVPYTDIGDSPGTLWRGAVLDLAVGSAVLVAITSWLGWWRPALRERRRSAHRWPVVAPVLMFLLALGNLAVTDWSRVGLDYLVAAVALGVLVGFAEELTTRGLLLTGLRGSVREGVAWFVSSALFGLMHGVNVVLGADVGPTAQQVVLAFAAGTVFYILRRVTGSLVWAMLLHGLWDTSLFLQAHAPAGPDLFAFGQLAVAVLALVVVRWVIVGADERPDRAAATSVATVGSAA
jgi:uncharacterized protein